MMYEKPPVPTGTVTEMIMGLYRYLCRLVDALNRAERERNNGR